MSTGQADSSPSGDDHSGPNASTTPPPDDAPEPGGRPDWGGRQHIDKSFDPDSDAADPASD